MRRSVQDNEVEAHEVGESSVADVKEDAQEGYTSTKRVHDAWP